MASPPSKLRILCLHGYRQCDQTFRQKTGSTRKLMKSIADFEFLSAPHLVAADNEVETSRSWWFSNEEAMSFSSKETSDVAIGFETSIEIVTKFIKENGPFDGIMGFSQGASMVHLLLAKNQLGEINLGNIRFAMFFSGFLSLSTKHDNLTSIKIDNVPSIHVFGASDEIVIMSKSEKLADRFSVAPLKIVHEGGHLVPAMSKYKEKINNFLSEQIEKKEKN